MIHQVLNVRSSVPHALTQSGWLSTYLAFTRVAATADTKVSQLEHSNNAAPFCGISFPVPTVIRPTSTYHMRPTAQILKARQAKF